MKKSCQRKGTAAVLICVLLAPLLGLLAFSVDYGYLLFIRTDLQRTADQVVLAAVRDLVPDDNGIQDEDAVRARVHEYVEYNLGSNFSVSDADIEIGRYDPETIFDSVDILNTGTKDTVRVTLRRDQAKSVSLYFARLFGSNSADVSATSTAVLQKARYLGPGTGVFPFAMQKSVWDDMLQGEEVSIYGNGQITGASGAAISGNYGTVDIGPTNNSTKDLRDQITDGLTQNDLDSLHDQNAIPSNQHIDASQSSLMLNADPGFSAGIKHAVEAVHGETKLIPIFEPGNSGNGGGNNAYYNIVGWGVVKIVDSSWNGSQNSSINIQKISGFDNTMAPAELSSQATSVEGMYTSPALVE